MISWKYRRFKSIWDFKYHPRISKIINRNTTVVKNSKEMHIHSQLFYIIEIPNAKKNLGYYMKSHCNNHKIFLINTVINRKVS